MPWFYYVGRFLMIVLLRLFTRWKVKGKENVPGEGPLLIAANHISAVDPPLLGVSLGRKVIFMAKRELFYSRVIGYFIRGFGSFPVHREQFDRKALRQADQLLARGLALVMFPEGKRSRRVQLQPAFSGSALIASHNGVPILPVGIIGTEKFRSIVWLLRRPQITVNVGRPFYLPPVSSKLTKVELAQLTDLIMRRVAELLPQEYLGNYAGKEITRH